MRFIVGLAGITLAGMSLVRSEASNCNFIIILDFTFILSVNLLKILMRSLISELVQNSGVKTIETAKGAISLR